LPESISHIVALGGASSDGTYLIGIVFEEMAGFAVAIADFINQKLTIVNDHSAQESLNVLKLIPLDCKNGDSSDFDYVLIIAERKV